MISRGLKLLSAFMLIGASFSSTEMVIDLSKHPADSEIVTDPMKGCPINNLAVGDLNGDKIDDIVIRGATDKNVICIIWGRSAFPPKLYLNDTLPNVRIFFGGKRAVPHRDPAASIGDINGDHIGDLLVPTDNGLIVLYGRRQWPTTVDLFSNPTDISVKVHQSLPVDSAMVWRGLVSTGDINGDNVDDFIFSHAVGEGAEKSLSPISEVHGGTWIFLGRKTWPSAAELEVGDADVVIDTKEDKTFWNYLRASRTADVNGDGFADIILGGWDAGATGGIHGSLVDGSKTAWIISGASEFPKRIELVSKLAEKRSVESKVKKPTVIEIDPRPYGLFVEGGIQNGDLTGDGLTDIVLSVIKQNLPAHVAHRQFCLITGKADLFSAAAGAPIRCVMIVGENIEQVGPLRVPPPLLGDFNGDHKEDLFVQSWSTLDFLGYFGGMISGSLVNLNTAVDVRITSPRKEHVTETIGFGIISAMGDVSGDGKSDLLIGSPLDRGGTIHILMGRRTIR